MYPFLRHNEVQVPTMRYYQDLFSADYLADWSFKTNECSTPVQIRINCDCDAGDYIHMLEEGTTEPYFIRCQECSKWWCSKWWCSNCGGPQRPPSGTPVGTPSIHSTATNPDACKNTRAAKALLYQAQTASLTRGTDYQASPMCSRNATASGNPPRVECDGCATIFCFTCGQKRSEQSWMPGQECAYLE